MLPSQNPRGGYRPPTPGPPRLVGAVFGLAFAGIGLSVIGFLWTSSGFGEPPFFFKMFGSLIALVFITVGGTAFAAAIKGHPPLTGPDDGAQSQAGAPPAGTGYTCPACGARLRADADVSPKGDVKCGYCRQWFNIHG
jgi:hypothetical protein